MGSVTAKQAAFITSLMGERDGYTKGFADRVAEGLLTAEMTAQKASEVIEWLLKLPKKAAPLPEGAAELVPGFWISDAPADSIDCWKVVKSKADRLYAKKLVVRHDHDGKAKGRYEYVPGGFAQLARNNPREFTVEEAREYGKAFSVCARCGAALSAEDSVERFMGPVCYKKVMAHGSAL